MSSVQSWTGDAIDVALAADFEGSLSCLGIELGTENYDMSGPLHSLIQSVSSSEYNGQQENGDTSPSSDSPFSTMQSSRSVCPTAQPKKTRLALGADEDVTSAIKRFCVSSEDKEDSNSSQNSRCRHSSSVPDLRTTGSPSLTTVNVLSPSMLSQMLQINDSPPPFIVRDSPMKEGFQYVLAAATSIATKINEESMTYLNQGQSYEIKLKKLGDLTEMKGKHLKSVIRVGFQERRLQYSEKEQIAQWQTQRVGERILDIDIPLSYGVHDVTNDPHNINIGEFMWDPTSETGVFIRINCISTEFTPKKHGGEKGAPFRIQIETFSQADDLTQRLHVASCQVKVFKPKGADRKHKTDREKMSKRSQAEQDKFKTSYDCTVFIECPTDTLYTTTPLPVTATSPTPLTSSLINYTPKVPSPDSKTALSSHKNFSSFEKSDSSDHAEASNHIREKSPSSDFRATNIIDVPVKEEQPFVSQPAVLFSVNTTLRPDSSRADTAYWLQENGFENFVESFINFNGSDMLRLNQEEASLICGLADGIRLHNLLHNRIIYPKKTIYVSLSNEKVFRAVYIHELTVSYLTAKLSVVFHLSLDTICDLRMYGPDTIEIHVTDEVVTYIKENSLFMLDILIEDHTCETYVLILKPYTNS